MSDLYSSSYNSAPNFNMERIYSDLRQIEAASQILKSKASTVLEVGCSGIPISNYVQETSGENSQKKFLVVEPDPVFYQSAKQNLIGKIASETLFFNDRLENIATPENKFDFIVINCLLQEIADVPAFLQSLIKFADANTKIWISVPNGDSLHKIIYQDIESAKSVDHSLRFGRKRNYTVGTLTTELEKFGIRPVMCQSRIIKPFWDYEMQKMLEDDSKINYLKSWLEFKSQESFLGAEIDLLCSITF